MGWWRIAGDGGGIDWSGSRGDLLGDREGGGLVNAVPDGVGKELYGGDTPADIFGSAVEQAVQAWQAAWGRNPTKRELRAALEFVMGGDDDLEE